MQASHLGLFWDILDHLELVWEDLRILEPTEIWGSEDAEGLVAIHSQEVPGILSFHEPQATRMSNIVRLLDRLLYILYSRASFILSSTSTVAHVLRSRSA